MLEKMKQTTITKVEQPTSNKTNAADETGAATFEEFMAKQAELTNIYSVEDLQNHYNAIHNANAGANVGGDEGIIGGDAVHGSDGEIVVKNGKASLCDIFKKAAKEYDVPYNLLVAVAKAESNFNESCVSGSGAMGVMQLMPGTAKYLGVKDAFDPEQNIMGGARYLSEKIKEQKGDVSLALAAYNAGSGAVKKYGGIPPYKETQNYVKKVTDYMKTTIDVPDKEFNVTFASSKATVQTAANQTVSQVASQTSNGTRTNDIDEAVVIIGEGNNGITLTYEAYKKYLELLDAGVG